MPYFTTLGIMPIRNGMGIFVMKRVPAETRILEFTGNIVDRDLINHVISRGYADTFLQIEKDKFLGKSGRLDDYINHSCDPNCGLDFSGARVYLKSIRPIQRGNEITYDYATSQWNYPARFSCSCGSPLCRTEIGNYDELPDDRKSRYLEKQAVAPYLLQLPGNSAECCATDIGSMRKYSCESSHDHRNDM